MTKIFIIKALSKSELADFYGVSVATLNKWIEPFAILAIERQHCKILTPDEVRQIVEKIGEP